jgi:hypothetical protein
MHNFGHYLLLSNATKTVNLSIPHCTKEQGPRAGAIEGSSTKKVKGHELPIIDKQKERKHLRDASLIGSDSILRGKDLKSSCGSSISSRRGNLYRRSMAYTDAQKRN